MILTMIAIWRTSVCESCPAFNVEKLPEAPHEEEVQLLCIVNVESPNLTGIHHILAFSLPKATLAYAVLFIRVILRIDTHY